MWKFIFSYYNNIRKKLTRRTHFIHQKTHKLVLLYFLMILAILFSWASALACVYICLLYFGLKPILACPILLLANLSLLGIFALLIQKQSRQIAIAVRRLFSNLLT